FANYFSDEIKNASMHACYQDYFQGGKIKQILIKWNKLKSRYMLFVYVKVMGLNVSPLLNL
ncbi:hypothetical protein L9F63_018912, partial [Diploptera punctata]